MHTTAQLGDEWHADHDQEETKSNTISLDPRPKVPTMEFSTAPVYPNAPYTDSWHSFFVIDKIIGICELFMEAEFLNQKKKRLSMLWSYLRAWTNPKNLIMPHPSDATKETAITLSWTVSSTFYNTH